MRNGKAGLRHALPGAGVAIVFGIAIIPLPVAAYVGPGAGLSALGSLLALLAAVVVAIVGFLWYPIKRILSKRRAAEIQVEADQNPGSAKPPSERPHDDETR
jgi:uncharacterized membrane protein YccC